jgi:hypothetical protein
MTMISDRVSETLNDPAQDLKLCQNNMNRITDSQLNGMVGRLNRLVGAPEQPYIGGKAQVGNYHLSHAYGGVCLNRMCNESGGVTCPLMSGHTTKRDCYDQIYSFIKGIETAFELVKVEIKEGSIA